MPTGDHPAIWWVRRDFRFDDNPALRAAADHGGSVLPVFVLDPSLLATAGPVRQAWLYASLHDLDAEIRQAGGPGLSLLRGRPAEVLPPLARSVEAQGIHISADFAPYGRRRDARVARALEGSGAELIATGSPYAVAPGTLFNASNRPFQVFSPFHRAWQEHGVHAPAAAVAPDSVDWTAAPPAAGADGAAARLPDADPELVKRAGEQAARQNWRTYLERTDGGVQDYAALHNDPAADATSHVSIGLRWGHLHPRTLLADLSPLASRGPAALARQIAWRDFFADVLFHRPEAVSAPVRTEFAAMQHDDPQINPAYAAKLEAWKQGRTGYPLVDAGMRQMLTEGWMHNRVRLVTGSFLVKDLHIPWWDGAAWFMDRLRDGDIAQNQLNWQWVAGCGSDPAPYFRIFNPTGQAEKFDPTGTYIRRWVPELADVPLEHLHQPWTAPGGPPTGYPAPIVDHAAERTESLARYAAIKA